MKDTYTGSDICAQTLIGLGVDTIFCITGAGNLAIVDALRRSDQIKIIYSHHEQAAVMEAQGYSRITGKTGVVLVTTGGGAANAVTGILSAHLDSVPLLVIAGNESSFHCENMSEFRAFGVQGFDSVGVMRPITKDSIRIHDVNQISNTLEKFWSETTRNRPGPVFIEFPMDLQRRNVEENPVGQKSRDVALESNLVSKMNLKTFSDELINFLNESIRPLLYLGNGIRDSKSYSLTLEFLKKTQIPFVVSWSATDLFEETDPLNVGRVGLYGDRAANILVQQADLLLCVGTRLAIPQVGYDKDDFARKATKWVVDIDPVELTKFPEDGWKTCETSSFNFVENLLNSQTLELQQEKISVWQQRINFVKKQLPRTEQVGPKFLGSEFVHSADVIESLNRVASDDAIFVTDVGAGLLSGHNMIKIRSGQRFFTSQGLGEMGFGLPGAIGAFFADETRQLICLNTDGGLMFNLQELQVVKHHSIPIKLFVFNNDGYGMIKISQENLFDGRMEGSGPASGVSFANFRKLADLFDLEYVQINGASVLDIEIESALASDKAVLIEIFMSPDQKYFPRLATSKLSDGTLVSPPLEDLDPLIPLENLENYLGYKANESSYHVRGIPYCE